MLESPASFGFKLRESDLYMPYAVRTVEVNSTIDDLSAFALENGSNLHELKSLNPWLRKSNLLVGEKQKYEVYFPNTVIE